MEGDKALYWTTDENGTKVTTTEVTDEPVYLTDSNGDIVYEVEVSDMVTTTKKKGLLGLWGKTVTTTWKETSGMLTAYNFGVKADNPINIGAENCSNIFKALAPLIAIYIFIIKNTKYEINCAVKLPLRAGIILITIELIAVPPIQD